MQHVILVGFRFGGPHDEIVGFVYNLDEEIIFSFEKNACFFKWKG